MSTMARRRSASPSQANDVESASHQDRSQGNNRSRNKGNKQQPALAGFWPQLQEKASSVLSSLRLPTRYLRQPMQLLKNNLYAAISIAVFAVLVGGLIMGYSAYRVRQQNQGFIPRMKTAAQRAGYATMDAFEQAKHSGESYYDSAIHGLEERTAPIKDAFLNAKEKVAEATGFAQHKPEGVIDSAKHQIEDFALNAKKTAEGLGSNVKNIIDSTTGYFNKGGEDLTSTLKANAAHMAHNAYDAAAHAAQATKEAAVHAADMASKKGEELTAATKKKAEELTGLTQQKREELLAKTKKTVDAQSVAAKHKIDEAAAAAKKRVDDLAEAAKKQADSAAGHPSWKFW